MNFPRRVARFFGPWLAFSALSGVGGAFCAGALVSILAFIAGVFSLLGGAMGGSFFFAATRLGHDFSPFASLVLLACLTGLVGGFIAGLIASLVGGNAGLLWSGGALLGLMLLTSPFSMTTWPGLGQPLLFGAFLGFTGLLFSHSFLTQSATLKEWKKPLAQWFQGSWLFSPPFAARFVGILLPVALYIGWEVALVAPTFLQNPNYVARLGRLSAWQNSRRVVTSSRRSYCQSNLKQILLGLAQYQQDYNDFYPPKPAAPQNGVAEVLQPYLKSTQLFQCPQEFYQPNGGDFKSGDFSDYWFNARFYSLNFAQVTSPTQSVMWGDGNTGAGEADAAYSLRALPPGFPPATRHFGTANYAFADGHVEALRPAAISTLPPGVAGASFLP